MGRPGGFTPVMLSGTACRLMLLLLGGVAVALAMNAVPRLALLTLEAVPLLVTLLAANKTHCFLVPTVLLYVRPAAVLAPWLPLGLSPTLPCGLVPAGAPI